jgi:hypothetical protein
MTHRVQEGALGECLAKGLLIQDPFGYGELDSILETGDSRVVQTASGGVRRGIRNREL